VRAPLLALVCLAACVPEGPPSAKNTQKRAVPARAREPWVQRPAGRPAPTGAAALPPIEDVFEDTFDRADLGRDWNALSPAWRIQGGRLCARGARNRGIWLLRRLPPSARIEFDAIAESADGDLKVELWGDGQSGATKASYSNATSYLAILGGWKNTKHVLARLDEHGDDRQFVDVDPGSDDERARPVEVGQVYRFVFERLDGRTLSWSVSGGQYFTWADEAPLAGPGHEHLGFNDWDAPVCFDNLRITAR